MPSRVKMLDRTFRSLRDVGMFYSVQICSIDGFKALKL